METINSISGYIEHYRRADLIKAPVIIHRLPRLSYRSKQNIYILRDDLSGFGLGGNKTRKLDFLLGDALAQNATSLVTLKATSFSRNAAFAAVACGLSLDVILPGTKTEHNPLSRALFRQTGTRIHYEPAGFDALAECQDKIVSKLRTGGDTVYVLHPGGSDTIGALSYLDIFRNIVDFSIHSNIHFSHIIHSSSSAGTQAGLVVGQSITGYDVRIIGISAALQRSVQVERVRELATSMARRLDAPFHAETIRVDDDFIGPGYAEPSKDGENAAQLFATTEGILLDPVYTGKAAAALLSYSERGIFKNGNVLFIHTGGNAGLYY